jgi:hypothetical protein
MFFFCSSLDVMINCIEYSKILYFLRLFFLPSSVKNVIWKILVKQTCEVESFSFFFPPRFFASWKTSSVKHHTHHRCMRHTSKCFYWWEYLSFVAVVFVVKDRKEELIKVALLFAFCIHRTKQVTRLWKAQPESFSGRRELLSCSYGVIHSMRFFITSTQLPAHCFQSKLTFFFFCKCVGWKR